MISVYHLNFLKNYNKPISSVFDAYEGFKFMGCDLHMIESFKGDNLCVDFDNENIAIGGIGYIKDYILQLKSKGFDIDIPNLVDYPDQLEKYLGRKIWVDKINNIFLDENQVFIKPKDKHKFFTGKLISSFADLIGCGLQDENYDVWCAEPIKPLVEYRVFVRYGRILDIRHYRGDYKIKPDYDVINSAIKDWVDSPKAYGIDFCVDDKYRTLLLEVNDGYALGNYGLHFIDYAKLLYTRWSEIAHCEDYFNF